MTQLLQSLCKIVAEATAAAALSGASVTLACTCLPCVKLRRCSDDWRKLVVIATASGGRRLKDHWKLRRAAAEMIVSKFRGMARDLAWHQLCQFVSTVDRCVFALDAGLHCGALRDPAGWLPTCSKHLYYWVEELLVECVSELLSQAPQSLSGRLNALRWQYFALTGSARKITRKLPDLQRKVELEDWLRDSLETIAEFSLDRASSGWLLSNNGVLPLMRQIYAFFISPAEREAKKDNPSSRVAKRRSGVIVASIVRTLANLCLFVDGTKFGEQLLLAGWLDECAQLASGRATSRLRLELNLHAARLLHNLRAVVLREIDHNSSVREPVYLDGVHILHWPKHRAAAMVDIVFIHGLIGNVLKTWRQKEPPHVQNSSQSGGGILVNRALASTKPLDRLKALLPLREKSEVREATAWREELDETRCCEDEELFSSRCWPQDWLSLDVARGRARILAADYATYLTRWGEPHNCPTLKHKVVQLDAKLARAKVGSRPIIWVGHSMGGLLIKQLVCADPRLAASSFGYAFLSTPHFGSRLASSHAQSKLSLLFLRPADDVAHLVHKGEYLAHLNRVFGHMLAHGHPRPVHVLNIGESLPSGGILTADGSAGTLGLVVTERSAYPGFGAYYCVDKRHLDTCKPWGRGDPVYVLLCRLIEEVLGRL